MAKFQHFRGFFAKEQTIQHIAGWSSPVAREAHNLEVAGSNPVPALDLPTIVGGGFFVSKSILSAINLQPIEADSVIFNA